MKPELGIRTVFVVEPETLTSESPVNFVKYGVWNSLAPASVLRLTSKGDKLIHGIQVKVDPIENEVGIRNNTSYEIRCELANSMCHVCPNC
jgi:hypothetical protein